MELLPLENKSVKGNEGARPQVELRLGVFKGGGEGVLNVREVSTCS